MFGPNLNDADYLIEGRKLINKDSILMRTTEQLIDKIYNVRDKELFKKIKEKYPDIKIVIATNHVSYVRNFIGEALGVEYLDDVIISAEIHKIKPNADYYEHIINKFNLKPEDHLAWRDSENNDEIIITIQKKVSAEDITGLIKEELPYNSVEIKKR